MNISNKPINTVTRTTGDFIIQANRLVLENRETGECIDVGRSLEGIEEIKRRLFILENPDPAMLEKFAALKEAYEGYKLIEGLVNAKTVQK